MCKVNSMIHSSFHIYNINQMPVQAIYYLRVDDARCLSGGHQPDSEYNCSFYTAQLTLQLNNIAYPGKTVTLTGLLIMVAIRCTATESHRTLSRQ